MKKITKIAYMMIMSFVIVLGVTPGKSMALPIYTRIQGIGINSLGDTAGATTNSSFKQVPAVFRLSTR